ncbi:glutamate-rich protein 2 isoform X2 [Denticeps clupeoides]|uniref:Glutamate-rich protein 2 n=1 Tax=Denticeps clupeoides TaxID=299321 RepID=A0AAY4E0V8_9TELE|nr:glutamate-rich protein 2 isoform X2 [Denticeps clupeoides]
MDGLQCIGKSAKCPSESQELVSIQLHNTRTGDFKDPTPTESTKSKSRQPHTSQVPIPGSKNQRRNTGADFRSPRHRGTAEYAGLPVLSHKDVQRDKLRKTKQPGPDVTGKSTRQTGVWQQVCEPGLSQTETAAAEENLHERGSSSSSSQCQSSACNQYNYSKPDDHSSEDDEEDEPVYKAPLELLAEFLKAVMEKDYTLSRKLCQMILIYEPENQEAKQFLPLIEDKLAQDEEERREEEESSGSNSGSEDETDSSGDLSSFSSSSSDLEDEDEDEDEGSGDEI